MSNLYSPTMIPELQQSSVDWWFGFPLYSQDGSIAAAVNLMRSGRTFEHIKNALIETYIGREGVIVIWEDYIGALWLILEKYSPMVYQVESYLYVPSICFTNLDKLL